MFHCSHPSQCHQPRDVRAGTHFKSLPASARTSGVWMESRNATPPSPSTRSEPAPTITSSRSTANRLVPCVSVMRKWFASTSSRSWPRNSWFSTAPYAFRVLMLRLRDDSGRGDGKPRRRACYRGLRSASGIERQLTDRDGLSVFRADRRCPQRVQHQRLSCKLDATGHNLQLAHTVLRTNRTRGKKQDSRK